MIIGRSVKFGNGFLVGLACLAAIPWAGCATTSADRARESAPEVAGEAPAPGAGADNAAARAAGGDNVAAQVAVYDGMSDWKPLQEARGIRVESVRLSAAGAILDFRYRIMNPAKARPMIDRRIKPFAIVQGSGEKLAVPSYPKVGPLRQTTRFGDPKPGKVYYILFSIPAKNVKPGDKVTVVVGDFRVENLVVQ